MLAPHYFFLVFAQRNDRLFFRSFQPFFQHIQFLLFLVHFVVADAIIVVAVVVFAVLYQFLELFFWLVVQQPCFLLVLAKLNYFCDVSNWWKQNQNAIGCLFQTYWFCCRFLEKVRNKHTGLLANFKNFKNVLQTLTNPCFACLLQQILERYCLLFDMLYAAG